MFWAAPSANCTDTCGLSVIFLVVIGGYTFIELLGLPVDIFNLMMAKSENSIGIAQGLTAQILNSLYMVINLVLIIATASFLIVPSITSRDLKELP